MTNLAQNLLDTAAKEGPHPALRMDEAALTYDEFRDAALRVAAGLRSRGVEPGDRVGMVLPNVLSFPVVFYGALLHTEALAFDVDEVVGGTWGAGKGAALRQHRATVLVGDHVHDVEGARAAGVLSVSVLTGSSRRSN